MQVMYQAFFDSKNSDLQSEMSRALIASSKSKTLGLKNAWKQKCFINRD